MKINDKTRIQVLEWHKQAFPDTDLIKQQLKFFEELHELKALNNFDNSDDEILEEIADCLIVILSLNRFEHGIAIIFICLEALERVLERFYKPLLKDEEINKAILKKLEINKNRKWEKVNGCYRHCE